MYNYDLFISERRNWRKEIKKKKKRCFTFCWKMEMGFGHMRHQVEMVKLVLVGVFDFWASGNQWSLRLDALCLSPPSLSLPLLLFLIGPDSRQARVWSQAFCPRLSTVIVFTLIFLVRPIHLLKSTKLKPNVAYKFLDLFHLFLYNRDSLLKILKKKKSFNITKKIIYIAMNFQSQIHRF